MTRTNAIAQAQERAIKTFRAWLAVSDDGITWVAIPATTSAYDEYAEVVEIGANGQIN